MNEQQHSVSNEQQKQKGGMMERLIDDYGREIRSLRFAVTTRCNLNCIYCHAEGEKRDSTQQNPLISAVPSL
jgi:MoaA/NifB/PqqE/SkfB family radical SAM enzyme